MDQAVVLAVVSFLSAVAGGPAWQLISKKWDKEEKERERLRGEIQQLTQSHKACEGDLAELKARLAAVEHHHKSYLARWIKDANKRLVWVNDKAFITIFAPCGYSRDQIDGRTFAELLDPQTAAEIDRLDHSALAQPGAAASSLVRLHPDLPIMHVVKIAATGRQGELIYEGYAYRTNDPELAYGAGLSRQFEQRAISAEHLIDGTS